MYRMIGLKDYNDYSTEFEVQISADNIVEAWDKASKILSIIYLQGIGAIKLYKIKEQTDE